MQVTETLSDGLKRGYTVVLPVADLEARRTERLASISKTLRLPGFRPGKVPLPIVKQRFGKDVSAEVLEDSVNEATRQVLSERGLRPVQAPKVDLVTENPTTLASDLEFKLEMELYPDIPLPDFSTIQLTRYKAELPADTVDKALQQIAKFNHTLEPLTEEALDARGFGAANGEVVTIDFEGKIDDVPFEGGKGTDMPVEIGGDGFIPGFAEQLDGSLPGQTRVLHVSFPENYGKADLAGKAATFDVKVKQVSSQTIPPIDDDLAKKLGAENLDAVREVIVSRQQQEFDSASRLRLKKELLDALAGMASFPVPETILNQEFNQIWQQFEQARKAGTQDDEDKDKDEETLKTEYRGIAERRVRLGLVIAEIGERNNIKVSDEELSRAVMDRARQVPGQEQKVWDFYRNNPNALASLRAPIFEDKVIDYILELAKITDKTVPREELYKDDEE
jgi:trigger factor